MCQRENEHNILGLFGGFFKSDLPQILVPLFKLEFCHFWLFPIEMLCELGKRKKQQDKKEPSGKLDFGLYSDRTWKPRPVDGDERCVCQRQKKYDIRAAWQFEGVHMRFTIRNTIWYGRRNTGNGLNERILGKECENSFARLQVIMGLRFRRWR